jgi:hypothetical protein
VTLAEAREAVKDQDSLRRKGVDPIEQRRRERAANVAKSRAEQPIAFREAAEAYLRAPVRPASTGTRAQRGSTRSRPTPTRSSAISPSKRSSFPTSSR